MTDRRSGGRDHLAAERHQVEGNRCLVHLGQGHAITAVRRSKQGKLALAQSTHGPEGLTAVLPEAAEGVGRREALERAPPKVGPAPKVVDAGEGAFMPRRDQLERVLL